MAAKVQIVSDNIQVADNQENIYITL